jgi:hypothetical protein
MPTSDIEKIDIISAVPDKIDGRYVMKVVYEIKSKGCYPVMRFKHYGKEELEELKGFSGKIDEVVRKIEQFK